MYYIVPIAYTPPRRYHEYTELTDMTRYHTRYQGDYAILTIVKITSRDAGLYTCRASNKYGFTKIQTVLHVKG